jgi:hypothetical protein
VDGDEADDLKFFFASRRGDLNFITDPAIEQSAADGRSCGDHAFFEVGLLAADELVFDLNAALNVKDNNARAITGTVLGDIGEVEHAEIAHTLFELADFGVDVTLALLGVLVFGVFGEVAVRARDGNFLGKLDAEFVLEEIDLLLEFLFDLLNWVGHSLTTLTEKNDAEPGLAELRHGTL